MSKFSCTSASISRLISIIPTGMLLLLLLTASLFGAADTLVKPDSNSPLHAKLAVIVEDEQVVK